MTKERIEKLLKAGANVILTTKGIDDMALKVRSKNNKFLSTLTLYSVLNLESNFVCFYFSTL